MKSDDEVGSSGFWYFSSSTSRLRNVDGSSRPAVPRLLVFAVLPWFWSVTGEIGLVMASPLLAALRSQDEMDAAGVGGPRDGRDGNDRRRVVWPRGAGRPAFRASSAIAALGIAGLAQADGYFHASSGQLFVQRRHGLGERVESVGVLRGQGDVQDVPLERQEGPDFTQFGRMQTDLHAVVPAAHG